MKNPKEYQTNMSLPSFLSPLSSILPLDSSNTYTTISEDKLRDLCTLAYSDNVDLQRSAALCFSELSEKCELSVQCTGCEIHYILC